VAFEVARGLNLPLDVFVVRKLGTPGQRELAMGAIATGGVRVINQELVEGLGIPQLTIDAVAAEEWKELARRELAYRGSGTAPEIHGKIVILVDDGIATGSTMLAAIRALKLQQPARLIVAVPTAAPAAFRQLEGKVDDLVALMTPEGFQAVGQWYQDFPQTSDEEVTRLLAQAAASCTSCQTA
jgi:predicted phosphoribosyltransferase